MVALPKVWDVQSNMVCLEYEQSLQNILSKIHMANDQIELTKHSMKALKSEASTADWQEVQVLQAAWQLQAVRIAELKAVRDSLLICSADIDNSKPTITQVFATEDDASQEICVYAAGNNLKYFTSAELLVKGFYVTILKYHVTDSIQIGNLFNGGIIVSVDGSTLLTREEAVNHKRLMDEERIKREEMYRRKKQEEYEEKERQRIEAERIVQQKQEEEKRQQLLREQEQLRLQSLRQREAQRIEQMKQKEKEKERWEQKQARLAEAEKRVKQSEAEHRERINQAQIAQQALIAQRQAERSKRERLRANLNVFQRVQFNYRRKQVERDEQILLTFAEAFKMYDELRTDPITDILFEVKVQVLIRRCNLSKDVECKAKPGFFGFVSDLFNSNKNNSLTNWNSLIKEIEMLLS